MGKNYLPLNRSYIAVLFSVVSIASAISPSFALEDRASASEDADKNVTVSFAFDRAPWRDVIKWIADESELALQFEDLPSGSFSYSDSQAFTPEAAIDRLNLFLLPQGFALVRSGKLLSVINLGDARSMQQLDALAKLVAPEALDSLGDNEVVKCVFALGDLKAEDAVQELSVLNLMTSPAVFEKTNRLLVTDRVLKLKSVKVVLNAFQPEALNNGTLMRNFALKHVEAEDILEVARPHLGLATGESIGIDVSISSDLQGQNIYVTGVEDKVKLIEGLVEALDVPSQTLTTVDGAHELRSHLVRGGNLESVYNVLQTLLAGNSMRLSMDERAGSIIALATPEIQNEIAQTVAELQASEADFEVIPLKSVDPFLAISLLEEMLDLPDAFDDPDDIDPDAPKIDADPGNMRLFVRAKRPQIEQIKKIIAGLDSDSQTGEMELRVLPITGSQAEELLEMVAEFWREESPIILLPSFGKAAEANERAINDRPRKGKLTALKNRGKNEIEQTHARVLTDNIYSQAPAIRCQVTPRGLLMQSDDTEALDKLEEQIRTIAGRVNSVASPPIVFYLRFVKPHDALRMLAELLDGGESARDGEGGSLVNGAVSSPGSFFGSIVSNRDGLTTMMRDTITVVADSRLNRLIAQGTPSDIERIQSYLEIIDKDKGLTSVETYGTSHVIELSFASANEVATAIRDAYAGRISGGQARSGAGPSRADEQARERDAKSKEEGDNSKKKDKKATASAGNSAELNLEPSMTIAVHEPSNSLIVIAPEQLFKEVEKLAKLIDSRSERSVEVVSSVNATLLQSVMEGREPSRTGRESRNRSSSAGAVERTRSGSTLSRQSLAEMLRSRYNR